MSEKKKKNFTGKEFTTSRRPVILKSERESTRDTTSKEKTEKEKQPTIILKTREQSTFKEERSQSPNKSQVSEDAPQLLKTEVKEKKTIEQKPSAPLKLMTEPIKLFDENLDFNTTALEYLNDSSCNYLVIGVLGTQGVGKSMILNLISQDSKNENICDLILNSHEVEKQSDQNTASGDKQIDNQFAEESEATSESKPDRFFKFKMQDMQHIESGVNCTKGIDMYISSDRLILLDCEAFCANPLPAQNASVATVMYLQIASFLMAVCHVLIAVQDWFTDYNFIRYIQAAEMLKPSLSTSSNAVSQDNSESAYTGESMPHLLLLHNRCVLEDFTPEAVEIMQDLYRKAFQKSDLQLKSGMYMYSDTNKNGLNIDSVCKGYSVDKCGSPINLFLLPEIYEDYDKRDIYRGHPTFIELAQRLRWMVLGVNRHQITNVPNLSEKGWFQYCNKAWETIRKCKFFKEYERFLP